MKHPSTVDPPTCSFVVAMPGIDGYERQQNVQLVRFVSQLRTAALVASRKASWPHPRTVVRADVEIVASDDRCGARTIDCIRDVLGRHVFDGPNAAKVREPVRKDGTEGIEITVRALEIAIPDEYVDASKRVELAERLDRVERSAIAVIDGPHESAEALMKTPPTLGKRGGGGGAAKGRSKRAYSLSKKCGACNHTATWHWQVDETNRRLLEPGPCHKCPPGPDRCGAFNPYRPTLPTITYCLRPNDHRLIIKSPGVHVDDVLHIADVSRYGGVEPNWHLVPLDHAVGKTVKKPERPGSRSSLAMIDRAYRHVVNGRTEIDGERVDNAFQIFRVLRYRYRNKFGPPKSLADRVGTTVAEINGILRDLEREHLETRAREC